ncbi:MAG TPA: LLM class flavin-dependent oxidoreductase [Chloroflexota bacterium]|nr:LLM class flavin-dependent oxidoreductase [Chloroflexota bacterium]
MPDAGLDGPDPYSRRFPVEAYARCYSDLVESARVADAVGFDSFWTTEHHFQREGYEPIPNGVMLSLALALQTRGMRFGTMFNVVPLWHPVRLAEDYAMADILSGGRMIFGAGWGSSMREAELFGLSFSRQDDEQNALNRSMFEEAMEVIRRAWSQDEFTFEGRHFALPRSGIRLYADGPPLERLTLVPRPIHPVETWQALNRESDFHYAARFGHVGMLNLHRAAETLDKWRRYGDLLAQYQGRSFRPGELRALKLVAHIADSRRAAFERVRRGHDERYRFLGAQRALTEYVDETGQPFRRGRLPTLEESMAQGGWLVGEPAEVRDRLLELQETFELEALIVQLQFHAMEQSVILEHIDRFANQVVAHLTAPPATAAQRP